MNSELNELELGFLPEKFDFSIKKKDDLDYSKIQYNSLYKSPLFYLNRLPNPQAFINLPFNVGINILNEIAERSLTPLEEYNLRISSEPFIFKGEVEPQSVIIFNQ